MPPAFKAVEKVRGPAGSLLIGHLSLLPLPTWMIWMEKKVGQVTFQGWFTCYMHLHATTLVCEYAQQRLAAAKATEKQPELSKAMGVELSGQQNNAMTYEIP